MYTHVIILLLKIKSVIIDEFLIIQLKIKNFVSTILFSVAFTFLIQNNFQQESHVRWGAAYCSRIIFPFNHIPSRYISLLACGDQKEEVKEEGKKGLLPNQDNPNEEGREHPGFAHMTEYIYIRVSIII